MSAALRHMLQDGGLHVDARRHTKLSWLDVRISRDVLPHLGRGTERKLVGRFRRLMVGDAQDLGM